MEKGVHVLAFVLLGRVVELQEQDGWQLPLLVKDITYDTPDDLNSDVVALSNVRGDGEGVGTPAVSEDTIKVEFLLDGSIGGVRLGGEMGQLMGGLISSVDNDAEVGFWLELPRNRLL